LRFLAWQVEDRTKARETPAAWKPNGELAKDEADLKILQQVNSAGLSGGGSKGENWRFLRLWFSHPDIGRSDSYLSVRFVDASGKDIVAEGGVSWQTHPRGEKDDPDGLGWAVVTRSPGQEDNIPESADVVLSYALEPWETVGTVNAAFEGPVTVGDYTVEEAEEITDTRLGDDQARTTLRFSRGNDNDHWMRRSVVAVLLDGQEITHRGSSMTSSREGVQVKYTYNAPLSDIKLFKFRTRPVQETTYKNVSLQPNTPATPEAATPATNPATQPAAK